MKFLYVFLSLILGLIIGAGSLYLTQNNNPISEVENSSNEKKPLYWVAPMDANYRRDEPGLSPMGMELVPFYGESDTVSPGAISISPEVINNLGVRTDVVKLSVFQESIKAVGMVNINQHQLSHVHPRVQGWIEKLYVKAVGDKVKKGDPIYEIYSPELVNAQEELLIALNQKNKNLIKAASARLSSLKVSASQIDELKRSKKVKQSITMYSAQTGVVDYINVVEGFYVKPGTSMMSIVDLSTLWFEAKIFERQASLLNSSMSAILRPSYEPNKKYIGEIDYIYPQLDKKNRTVVVRIVLDNKDGSLKPHMFMDVELLAQKKEKVLQIPSEALIRTGDHNVVVMALENGKFKSVYVDVGRINTHWVEIIKGLEKGDKIVTSGQFLIDSESSKNSDFKRLESLAKEKIKMEEKPKSVWVEASFNSIDVEMLKANIKHPAIELWKWPAMDMNFELDKSLELNKIKLNEKVTIEITKKGKKYIVSKIKNGIEKVESLDKVWVKASFNSINKTKVNVTHAAIEQWNWPEMKMNFELAENVDASKVQINIPVMIEITKFSKKDYKITEIKYDQETESHSEVGS